MLTSAKILFEKAYREQYSLGSFNTSNLEITQGIILGAAESSAPVIVSVSEKSVNYAGLNTIIAMIKALSEDNRAIPFTLHLDHGKSYKTVTRAIKLGFNSVQIDGSGLPYEKNVELTRKVVGYAHDFDVPVQGELAKIPKTADEIDLRKLEDSFTKPEEAVDFVKRTGVDTLAVSVGTAHGLFEGKERIHLDLLEEIHNAVGIPLVLHGTSGVPDDQLREAVKHGVVEVNIDTALRREFIGAIKKKMKDDPDEIDPRIILAEGRVAVKDVVEHYIEVLGGLNKA